jgi:hypothetical protein
VVEPVLEPVVELVETAETKRPVVELVETAETPSRPHFPGGRKGVAAVG